MLPARVPDGDGDDPIVAHEDFLRLLNEPTDADDGDEDGDESGVVISDKVSAADLNLKTHPLSALPHSLLAVAATFAANIVVAVAAGSAVAVVGANVGGAAIGVVGGLVLAVLLLHPSLLLGFLLIKHARFGNSDRAILKLERAAHPRFFAVVDDVMARVGVSDIDVYFAAGANAHHAVVHGRPAVIIGYGVFAPYSLTALRSTLGHELGHALGNDASDLDGIAFDIITQLAKGRRLAGPWWRLLVRRSKADAMRRSRLREHAADFWGGLAAGAGTTEACLVEDRRSGLLWSIYQADLEVLLEAGFRPRSFSQLYRDALLVADLLDFGVRPSQAATCEQSSHPGDAARVEVAEARLAPFASFDIADAADGRFACHLLDNAVDVGEEAIELDVDLRVGDGNGDHLVSVDNDDLWSVYLRVLRPRFWALMHEAFGVAADDDDASVLSLMPLLRLRAEAGARFFVKDPDDELADDNGDVDISAKVMAWFLDLLSAEGLLCGNTDVGAVRAFELGDEEQFALTLSIRLSNGDRWDELEAAVDARAAVTAAHGIAAGDGSVEERDGRRL